MSITFNLLSKRTSGVSPVIFAVGIVLHIFHPEIKNLPTIMYNKLDPCLYILPPSPYPDQITLAIALPITIIIRQKIISS